MDNVSDFMAPAVVEIPIVNNNKKRKKIENKDEERNDLRKKARFFCQSPEQWRSVSKYNIVRLKDFIESKEYDQNNKMTTSVFDFIHSTLGIMLDKISQGDGFVEDKIRNDMLLRESIEFEGAEFVRYMNSKMRVIALSLIDTYNGKRQQQKEKPVVILEINEGDDNSQTEQENVPVETEVDTIPADRTDNIEEET